jgi:hypothetical protein
MQAALRLSALATVSTVVRSNPLRTEKFSILISGSPAGKLVQTMRTDGVVETWCWWLAILCATSAMSGFADVKNGVVYRSAELYEVLGVKPQ